MKNLNRLIFPIVLFFLWTISPANAEQEKVVEKSFNVGKGGTLRLESDKGSVDIQTHSASTVDITVQLIADTFSKGRAEELFERFTLDFNHNGDDVYVVGEWEDGWFKRSNDLKVKYRIIVPDKYNVDVETSGGSISVEDLEGKVDTKTSGGSISIGEIKGRVTAKTSGGSISVRKCSEAADAYTSGGSIELGEIGGSVEAKTSGGSISVDGVNGDLAAYTSGGGLHLRNVKGNLTGKTSGGSIRAELLTQTTAPVELRTSGGGITLTVPPDFKADVDAHTSGGRVVTDLPVTVRGTIGKNSLQGKLNGGGEMVVLKTSGGNIEIRER